MIKEDLEKDLSEGVVIFKFTKANGEVRSAIGTRSQQLIPKDTSLLEILKLSVEKVVKEFPKLPTFTKVTTTDFENTLNTYEEILKRLVPVKETLDKLNANWKPKVESPEVVKYYDLISVGWRSFKLNSIIETEWKKQ